MGIKSKKKKVKTSKLKDIDSKFKSVSIKN